MEENIESIYVHTFTILNSCTSSFTLKFTTNRWTIQWL